MTFYDPLIADVTAILTELGQAGSIKRTTTTGGGPSDPSGGVETVTSYPARLVVFPVSPDRIDGTNIIATDFEVTMAPLAVEVEASDKVVCSEGELTIKQVGKQAPEGTIVAYLMVCSK